MKNKFFTTICLSIFVFFSVLSFSHAASQNNTPFKVVVILQKGTPLDYKVVKVIYAGNKDSAVINEIKLNRGNIKGVTPQKTVKFGESATATCSQYDDIIEVYIKTSEGSWTFNLNP